MDGMSEFTVPGTEPIFVYGYGEHINPVGVYQFDYAAPAGDEDATINKVQRGDLVYVSAAGKIKKLKTTTTNADALANIIGIVLHVKDDNGNILNDPVTYTADGGQITVGFAEDTPWFGDQVYIHNDDVTSPAPNTRDAFAYATHVTGSVLAGLVRKGMDCCGRATFRFV